MNGIPLAALALLFGLQEQGPAPLPFLLPGETLRGEIADGDPVVRTEVIDRDHDYAPVVGRSVSFRVERAGPYHIELRSLYFNAYLVLRDEGGALLAEDDNGLVWTHARIHSERLEPGVYVVQACAQRGERGPFELTLKTGAPERLPQDARAEADLREAEQRVERLEEIEGPEGPTVALALHDLGYHLQSLGEYARARSRFERALAIREKLFGPDHRDVAVSLIGLGQARERLGEYAAARELFERSIATFEALGLSDSEDAMNALYNLGALLIYQGQYGESRRRLEQCLEISERVLGPEHASTVEIVAALAIVLWNEGRLADARSMLERVRAVQERVAPDSLSFADTLQNLAVLVQTLGDYPAARPLFERALALYEDRLGPDHPKTLVCLNNLALLLRDQGDEEAAIPYLRRIVAAYEAAGGPWNRDTLSFLHNLGTSLTRRGDVAEARGIMERALELTEQVLGPNHQDVASTLLGLSNLAWADGDLETARQRLERAREIYWQRLGPDHPETAEVQRSLAIVLWEAGDPAAAEPLMLEALEDLRAVFGAEHPTTVKALGELALMRADLGRPGEAWETIHRAHRAREAHLRRVLISLSESERFLYTAGVRWELDALLALALDVDDPAAGTMAYESLLTWKGQVTRLLATGRERLMVSTSPEQRALLDELRACQGELSKIALEAGALDSGARERRMAELRGERNRLEVELQRRVAPSDQPARVSFAELRGALPEDSAVVDFFVHPVYLPARREGGKVRRGGWGEPHVSAWITRPGRDEPARVDLGPAPPAEAAVRDFLEDLVARRGEPIGAGTRSDAGPALRRLLWEPLAAHLEGVGTVFVSPDRFLGTLPLEVLPLADGSFLVELHGFVYLGDAASLVGLDPRADVDIGRSLLSVGGVDFRARADRGESPPGELLARADSPAPVFRGSFSNYWPRLPASVNEAQVVIDLHEDTFGTGGRRLSLRGSEATEERLKLELPRHAVLHLATHGFFQPEGTPSMWEAALDERGKRGKRGMRMGEEAQRLVGMHPGLLSGLVCAGANVPAPDDRDDGYLTAEEVGWLDLSGVELVALSACETGLGSARSGEGLIGLRRAFRTAGAKTVVSSLWSVKDESAAELMRDFYRNLWTKRMGRLEALRAAQLSMLARNRMVEDDPLPATWGAFVLSGEWR